MLPGDRLLCAFVKPQELGREFKAWPPHLTIIPWFRLNTPTKELADNLQERIGSQYKFVASVGREAHLGNNKLVNIVDTRAPFENLEEKSRSLLKEMGAWIVDETTKQRRLFLPHVTAQADERLRQGDMFTCDRLYIVSQQGAHKLVEQEVRFGEMAA